MTFPTPLLPDLRAQGWQYLQSAIPGLAPVLRRMVARPLSDMTAGMTYLQYRYLANLAIQFFWDTATGTYLDRLASIFGLTREAASAAGGNCIFTGTSGTPVPAGTLVVAPDQITTFATQSTVTLASSTATVAIVAVTASLGSVGNLPGGTPMALAVAIAGVNAVGALDSNGTSGGTDVESDTELRARVLTRIQQPPQGGALNDYWSWTRLQPGVTRAWVYPQGGGYGTCQVAFVCDGRSNIIPLSGDVTAVQALLTEYAPVIGNSVAYAPTPQNVNVTIAHLNPSSAQAAVQASLADLFATNSLPGGASWGDYGAIHPGPITNAGTLDLGQIYSAIQTSTGVISFDLTTPSADVVVGTGTLALLGTVTFT